MKVLLATEKPFAAAAVQGIRKAIEEGGHTLAILEKYTDRAQLLEAVKDADALIVRSDIVDGALMDVALQMKIVVRAAPDTTISTSKLLQPIISWSKTPPDKIPMPWPNWSSGLP